jgi:hypothetical protein
MGSGGKKMDESLMIEVYLALAQEMLEFAEIAIGITHEVIPEWE